MKTEVCRSIYELSVKISDLSSKSVVWVRVTPFAVIYGNQAYLVEWIE